MNRCWRCRGQVVLDPRVTAHIKTTLGEAYEALPVEGNQYLLNRINEMRNLLVVGTFLAVEQEEVDG